MTEAQQTSVEDLEKIMNGLDSGNAQPADQSDLKRDTNPLQLKEFINVKQLSEDVAFNPANLDKDISEHASKFVYYANQSRLARRQYETMKAAFEILEARLDNIHRTALKADGKATEAQIRSAVISDPRWWAANKRLIDSRAIHELANSAGEAFSHRRDMLVQVNKDLHEERKGQMRFVGVGSSVANTAAAVAAMGFTAGMAAKSQG